MLGLRLRYQHLESHRWRARVVGVVVAVLGRLHRILVEGIDVEVTRDDRSIVGLAFTLTGHYPNTLAGETRVAEGANRQVVAMTWDELAAGAGRAIPEHPLAGSSRPKQRWITSNTRPSTSLAESRTGGLGCSVNDMPQAPSSNAPQKGTSPLSSSMMSLEATI